MKQYKADVVVVGAGAGGLAAAIEVKKAKLDVLIIERDRESTWQSYLNQDKHSKRGIINKEAYFIQAKELLSHFHELVNSNPDHYILIRYENLLLNTDKEMSRIWEFLDVNPITGLKQLMKEPEY